MRLAVFSDIHGNLEALDAFLADVANRRVDRYVCLGDIVGYGANPNECIERVRAIPNINIILGNHDAGAVWLTSPYGMNKEAKEAILWTMDVLTPEHADFLKTLKPKIVMADMSFSHANPYNPGAWRYVDTRKYAARSFSRTREKLLFVGHTHRSLMVTKKNFFKIILEIPKDNTPLTVSEHSRHIFNGGSIGQPRDGKPLAGYLIYDTRKKRVTIHRVAYDYQEAAQKILAAGLPDYLAKRLPKGR